MTFSWNTFVRVGPTLLVLALLGSGWLAWHEVAIHYLDPGDAGTEAVDNAERTQVEINADKMAAAGIVTAVVEPRSELLSIVVPGRVAYDPAQLVALRVGSAGILTQVLVRPGDRVEAGQVLARMSSPEIGTARADQLHCAAELELARRQLAWDQSRSESIGQLISAIARGIAPEEIRKNFTNQLIGDAREKLLSAYSEKLLASSLAARVSEMADSGAVPARTVEERRSQLESKSAALAGVMEQTQFDAERAARTAQIAVDDAQRRYLIASGRVSTLLGLSAPGNVVDATDDSRANDLSLIEIRAPRSGTIEKRLFNDNERVEAGAAIVEIADTSRLWIKADIRESQWTALALQAGQQVICTSPALPNDRLQATIVMMGREVDPQTNAVPLVASIENAYGRLRPGLYVRVQLPMGETTSQIVVPDSAIARHEGQSFVFVTTDGHTFQRRDVRIGRSSSGGAGAMAGAQAAAAPDGGANTGQQSQAMTEIVAGLSAGERIAVSGVFHLKSELLLEAEE